MAHDERDLPDELQDVRSRADAPVLAETRETLLAALGQRVGVLRDEAVTARKSSGIEEVWMAAEEAYYGIDDNNRHEFAKAKWSKPTSMAGPVTETTKDRNNTKSTVFVRLTSRYVDMGAAKISEITLPIDDKAFTLSPTPVPDLAEAQSSTEPLKQHPVTGEQGQVMRAPITGEQPGPDGKVPATQGDLAKATLDKASTSAKKAETRIYDWMTEAKYPREARKMIKAAARIGSGVLKAPFPCVRTSMARVDGKLIKKRKVAPGLRAVSAWNLYPDPACGENIHDGDFIFECDQLTPAKLKALKKEVVKNLKTDTLVPVYLHDQIDKVLKEGPGKCNVSEAGNPNEKPQNKDLQFQIWYFTGVLTRDQMTLMGAVGLDDLPAEVVDIDCVITMVNDSVIRATINPLESGRFPYHVLCWAEREGSWAGVGVGEQIIVAQRVVNAATRKLLDNAGLSAGVQIILDRQSIEPSDGVWAITPNKLWFLKAGATQQDVRAIMTAIEMPNLGDELMKIIDYGFRLAEESSNIPLVTQGKQTENSPDTFGQAELENSNAHTLLRSIAYALDDSITEPVVHDLYEWLLLDDDVPEEEKGDWVIDAKGSIAMVEKAIQELILAQLIPLSKDPAYGLNPKLTVEKYLRAKRINPSDVQYTQAEMEEMAKRPPPEDPVIIAAKLRNASAEKIAQGKDSTTMEKAKLDTDRDTAYQEALNQRADIQADSDAAERADKRELEYYRENNSLKKELEKVKAMLTAKTMELRTQVQLSADGSGPQVATPVAEPEGRAPDGQAFTK